MVRKLLFLMFVLCFAITASCSTRADPVPQAGLPNPASVYCEENGGKVELRPDSSGGTASICVFPDGSECDEWAFFRGECRPGDSTEIASSRTPLASVGGEERSGRQIVFYSNRGSGYDNVYLLDVDTSSLTQLTGNETSTFSGPFSPNGKRLLFTGFGLTHSFVGVMNPDGSSQTDLTNRADSDEAFPAWSPDGKQIAFTSRRDKNNEVYVMNADGSDSTRLTDRLGDDFAPAWSPDGSRIVFVSDRDNQTGVYSLYLMDADGTNVVRLTHGPGSDTSPDWSADGTRIVYQSIREGQADIYVINLDGSGETGLTQNPADDYSPRWSPEGSQIAFQTRRDGNWEIYLMNSDGSGPVNLTNDPSDDQSPYWRP